MKKILLSLLFVLILSTCNLSGDIIPTTNSSKPIVSCGDGVCNGPENAASCPQDCTGAITTEEKSLLPPGNDMLPADGENTYWVINPNSGVRLYVRFFYPNVWNGADLLPTLILMPGGIAPSDPEKAARLTGHGFVVIIFDADGRGQSEGTEDYNGFITQDGLAAVINAAISMPGVDTSRYGLVSYSYGVTAATGALARYPDLPIKFYIDWEGPVDRNYTTSGCTGQTHNIDWQPCSNNAWWSEREAVIFIGSIRIPYQRVQSQKDHVQPNNNHAIDIVNAAVAGGVPWVRLNDYPANQSYDKNNPPAMLSDSFDARMDAIIAEYAQDIIVDVLPTLP